jgi:REP element-mobilizing transposase RayT
MVRGLNRQVIFQDARDREDFLARLKTVCATTGLHVLAWALLPNHAHLLLRTGTRPLARAMRSLLTGYAGAFNRRHRRIGHLFQNRYKSILVEEEPYLLELVRYIHLNPLRVGLVETLAALDRYPWTGHSVLMGWVGRPWQTVANVLGQYGDRVGEARRRYRAFVANGIVQGRRPELQGGGLIRSVGGWQAVLSLRRGREAWVADERLLGSSGFVERIQHDVTAQEASLPRSRALAALPTLIRRAAATWEITPAELISGGRRRPVAHARAVVSHLAVLRLGVPIALVARHLSVAHTTVRLGVVQGATLLARQGLTPEALLPMSGKYPS